MTNKKIIPNHIAVIMGGNESWAIERNLPFLDGYKKGYEKIRFMPVWFFSKGVKNVSILVFSSSDWTRPREEVNSLMKYLKTLLSDNKEEFIKNDWHVMFTGRVDELPGDLPEICSELERETRDGKKGRLNICINYNGRDEIIQAIQKMMSNNIKEEQVHEGIVRKYLYNNKMEDPDLMICFGGVQNLGGFQLWQAESSELMFLKKDWPDFEPVDVDNIISEYSERKTIEE